MEGDGIVGNAGDVEMTGLSSPARDDGVRSGQANGSRAQRHLSLVPPGHEIADVRVRKRPLVKAEWIGAGGVISALHPVSLDNWVCSAPSRCHDETREQGKNGWSPDSSAPADA